MSNLLQHLYHSHRTQAIVSLFAMSVLIFNPYLQFSVAGNIANATNINICQPVYADFETYLVGQEFSNGDSLLDATVDVNSNGNNNTAMIFDSLNPTGNDNDLSTKQSGSHQAYGLDNNIELGKVLIISEDGDSSDPDDESKGGTITMNYDNAINLDNIGFLDIEETGGSVRVYNGASLKGTFTILAKGDNSYQTVNINKNDINKIVIKLAGSGAITYIDYCIPKVEAPYCNLVITKSDDGYDPIQAGNNIVYHLTLQNTGTDKCVGGGVKLQDKYPDSQLEYVSYQLGDNNYPFSGSQFIHSGNELTWNFATVETASKDNWNGLRTVDVTFKVKDFYNVKKLLPINFVHILVQKIKMELKLIGVTILQKIQL